MMPGRAGLTDAGKTSDPLAASSRLSRSLIVSSYAVYLSYWRN